MSFFSELKRRNVYRVAALYIVVSWLSMQAADVFTSVLALPEWTGGLIFLLLVIGFPLALISAWAFELTPEGLRRETDSESDGPHTTCSHKKLDILLVAVITVTLAYFGLKHYWQSAPESVEPGEIRSIVVLPLDNLMNDPEQGY